MITNQRIISIRINRGPPLPVRREAVSDKNARGKRAMIPTIMRREIPLPIPLSVIFSPNHIAKIVPVTKISTAGTIKLSPLPKRKAESGTPNLLIPYKYTGACTIHIAIVSHRVIWFIFLRPLSPSFCSFWR